MVEQIEVTLKDGSKWLISADGNYEDYWSSAKFIIVGRISAEPIDGHPFINPKEYLPQNPIDLKNVDDFIYNMKNIDYVDELFRP